ncbi:MAG: hypothetical protein U0894_01585 [Pirellulales bacterium]
MPPLGFWGFAALTAIILIVLLAIAVYRTRLSPIQLAAWLLANVLTRGLWRAKVMASFPLSPDKEPSLSAIIAAASTHSFCKP